MLSSMSSTSSFVTEVLQNAGRLDKEDLHAKLGSLSKKTSELKLEVYDSLQKKHQDFYPNLMTAVDLQARVKTLNVEMENVAARVEKDIQTQLNISATEFQDLSSQLNESHTILHILSRLTQLDDALAGYDMAKEENNYKDAAAYLSKVEIILSTCNGPRDDEIKILQAVKEKYLKEYEKLKCDVANAWLKLGHWEILKPDEKIKKEEISIRVSLCITRCENHKAVSPNLVQAMQDLGILTKKVAQFGDQLLKSVIEPIITCSELQVKVDESEKSSILEISGKRKSVTDVRTPEKCFSDLLKVLEFISEHVFNTVVDVSDPAPSSVPLMLLLGTHIDSLFVEMVITNSLSHSIPSNSSELQKYKEVINATQGFQDILIKMSFLKSSDTTLSDYVNDVNVLFANKKCQDFLAHARGLMTSEIHNMVCIRPVSSDELPSLGLEGTATKRSKADLGLGTEGMLSSKTFQFPTCYISTSIQELMRLVYATLTDATSTESTLQCRVQLFYAVRNMIMLYCDNVPTYHRESLENLPQITALYHNNCMYIAHHLLTLGHQFRPHLPDPLAKGAATFTDLVPKLRRLGTEMLLRQMAKQRDTLLEYLSTTQGFVSVSEGDNYNRIERCIKQLLHQIHRLSNLWHLVLPDSLFYKFIGTLVNSVLVEILAKITTLEDISADDASQLHALMDIISNKTPTFYEVELNDTKPQSVQVLLHKHIRKWNKFTELMWIMNAGLQDISDRWADGAGPLAVEFQTNEVKQLIRAIFQNTDQRSKVLTTII